MKCPPNSDNMMLNIAQETNALEHERKREQKKLSKRQREAGKLLFWTLLALLVIFIGIYVLAHL